jgi:hypothetical protein
MKKILQIITGMTAGLVLILLTQSASGAISSSDFDDELMIRDIRWSDIFGPRKDATDLYKLVYSNLSVKPKVNALRDSAQKFGLTVAEAEKIINGSVSGLINNPSKEYRDISFAQLYDEYAAINEYFNDTLDLYSLREELNAIALPNEIFSNGDLSDSGFDLIDDFRQMQKILFTSESSLSTGYNFGSGVSSPNKDILSEREINEFGGVSGQSSNAGESTASGLSGNTGSDTLDLSDAVASGENSPVQEISEPLILESDICETGEGANEVADALFEFEENESANENADKENDEDMSDSNGTTGLKTDNASNSEYSLLSDDGDINPAKRSGWGGSFCPDIIPSSSKSGDGYSYLAGQNGFESLSYIGDSLLNGTLSAGAGAILGGDNLSLKIAVCFSTELIYKTYSTYMPSQSCIKCEVDRINETLNEVLSHSLIPNKVTGNYMESAKCKDGFSLVPSLNIIAVPAPISTPMNMDMISEKNIFEEWNDFVSEYHPFLSDAGKIPGDFESDFILENAPEDRQLTEVMLEAKKTMDGNLADALEKTTAMDFSKDLADKNMYAKEFFLQIRQFANMFKSIEQIIKDMDTDALSKIKDKPSI